MTRSVLRKVIIRDRGTRTWEDGRQHLFATDVLECYHEVSVAAPDIDCPRRRCDQCGPTCRCHLCRKERG